MIFFKKNWLTLILSLLYLVVVFIYIWFCSDRSRPLAINELGDFLSGVFAPLAFLFLILGYIQQGRELKQNTDALKLQAEELKNSVEQQKELVKTTKEEFEFTVKQLSIQKQKEIVLRQPFLHLNRSLIHRAVNKPFDPNRHPSLLGDHEFDILQVEITLLNSRAIARDVRLAVSTPALKGIFFTKTFNVFSPNSVEKLSFNFKYPTIFDKTNKVQLEVCLVYLDELDTQMDQRYLFEIRRDIQTFDFSHSFYLSSKSY